MAARKKAVAKPAAVQVEPEPQEQQLPEPEPIETVQVEPEPESPEPDPAESEPEDLGDGGLAALQAKFDDAAKKGYFGPDKEF